MAFVVDRTARLLATIAIAGIFAGALFSLWDSNRIERLGHTKGLAADAEHIYVVTDPAIFVLDRDGALREEVPVASFGLGYLFSDAAVRQGELILGDSDAGTVVACDLSARRCQPAIRKEGEMAKWFSWTLKFTVDNRGHLFVSDAHRNTVEEYAPDGAHLRTYQPAPGLRFPMGVGLDAGQNLVVADSNGHRLVAFKTDDGTAGETAWSLPTRDAPVDTGRHRPMMLAHATDGRWWVVMNNRAADGGNVVIFDGEEHAPQRIPLRSDADPSNLLALDSQVLLADFSRFELLAFGLDGTPLGEFGDAAFRSRFGALEQQRREWVAERYLAVGALAAFILIGLYAGILDQRARQRITSRAPGQVAPLPASSADLAGRATPDSAGISWLEPQPAFLRKSKQLFGAVIAIQLLFAALFWFFSPAMGMLFAGFAVIMALVSLLAYTRLARLAIGVGGGRIHLRGANGQVTSAAPDTVRCSRNRVRIGNTIVPLRSHGGSNEVFQGDALQAVLALIPQPNHVPEWKLMLVQEWIMIGAALLLVAGTELWQLLR